MGKAFLILNLWAIAAFGVPCLTGTAPCLERFLIAGRTLPVYRSFPLAGEAQVNRAVIVVHGTDRNADDYFTDVAESARRAGAESDTLILAPRFQTLDDNPAATDLYWTSSGWKQGDGSRNPGATVSSYAAVDRLLEHLADSDRYPALKTIVVTGHSAGGQLLSRFAATSRTEGKLANRSLIYAIANPSTYLYPTRHRPAGSHQFAVPGAGCPDYDEYPYGLEKRNSYTAALTPGEIEAHLKQRTIVVFLGEADTGLDYLDTSCGANLQGRNRFERGSAYVEYLETYFHPPGLVRATVPGVGHSGKDMYQSPEGQALLFSLTRSP